MRSQYLFQSLKWSLPLSVNNMHAPFDDSVTWEMPDRGEVLHAPTRTFLDPSRSPSDWFTFYKVLNHHDQKLLALLLLSHEHLLAGFAVPGTGHGELSKPGVLRNLLEEKSHEEETC